MKMNKKELWLNLKGYNFDHIVPAQLMDEVREMFGGEKASKRAFRKKIARKLGWTDDFAKKAVNEYLKFVYLGNTSDYAVTPSKVIDQVWHEHILFTQGYRKFCDDVIGQPFDHNPELIPMDAQTGIFNAQYQQTLEQYKKEFNTDAPKDIWGKPKFDVSKVPEQKYESKKRKESDSVVASSSDDNLPLYLYFNSIDSGGHHSSMHEFSGYDNGNAGGGGGGSSFESHSSHDAGSSHSSHSDASSSDGGGHSSSSDSSSSSCSSSSCGSSCGGGGGD